MNAPGDNVLSFDSRGGRSLLLVLFAIGIGFASYRYGARDGYLSFNFVVGMSVAVLTLYLGLTHARVVVDGGLRTVTRERRYFGLIRRHSTDSFEAFSAIGVYLGDDEGRAYWGVALDKDGVFPIDFHTRVILGDASKPLARCKMNGKTIEPVFVGDDRTRAERVIANLARVMQLPVRGDVRVDGPPFLTEDSSKIGRG